MLRIYGSARSRGVRTLWMAGELGLEYEHLDYAPRSPGTRTPEYLALNPNARVPTIDDDGFVLSELMAINLYLAKKHGKLYPTDAKNEAPRLAVELLGDRPARPAVDHLCQQRLRAAGGAARSRRRQGAHGTRSCRRSTCWRSRWASRNGSPASEFSVADLNVAAAMVRALTFDLGKWPKVHAWLHRCWDRPAGKRALAMRE